LQTALSSGAEFWQRRNKNKSATTQVEILRGAFQLCNSFYARRATKRFISADLNRRHFKVKFECLRSEEFGTRCLTFEVRASE